jgi:hypothetical protein
MHEYLSLYAVLFAQACISQTLISSCDLYMRCFWTEKQLQNINYHRTDNL